MVADALPRAALLGTAALIAGDHDEFAALFLTVGVVMLASLALIEPATTRAAGLNREAPRKYQPDRGNLSLGAGSWKAGGFERAGIAESNATLSA